MKQNRMFFVTTSQAGKGSLPQVFTLPAATVAFVLAVSPAATAADYTWDGGGADNAWSSGANWSGDPGTVTMGIDSVQTFYNPGTTDLTTYLGTSNYTLGKLNFNADADSDVTIRLYSTVNGSGGTGRTLTFAVSTGNAELNVDPGATGNFNIGLNGVFTLNNNLDVNHSGTGTLTFSRAIGDSGTFGITKNGTGTLILIGGSTYDGTTTLNAGTMRLGSSSAGSVGAITSSPIGIGGLTINGGGLSTEGTTARTILNAVTFTGNATLGDATNNGKLNFSAAADLGTAVRTLTLNSAAQFNGNISGVGGGITKEGTGTLTLAGTSNDYTGLTTVNLGVLQVNHANALGSTAAGTVVNGSNGASNAFGTALELNGVSIGSGESLTLASGTTTDFRATLRTAGTTTNTWAGGVLLTGSKAVQFHTGSAGGSLEVSGPITHSSFTGSVNLRGSGTGTLSGGVTLSNTTNLQVFEVSTWNINTSGNTWGNTSVFGAATLVLGANDALPTTTRVTLGSANDNSSGTLKLNGKNQTVAGLAISGSGTANKIVNGNATASALTVNNSIAYDFSGVLGGTGTDENNFSLTKTNSGTLTLSGTNTYTGATTISAGTLALGATGSIANSSGVALTSSTAKFNVTTANFTLGASQTLSGIGTVENNGMTFTANGILAPGSSPGTLTVDGGTFALGVGGDYNFQVLDAAGLAGTGYDTHSLINGATLDLSSLTAASYTINLFSLLSTGPDVAGDASNFNNTLNYSWTLFSTANTITNFDAADFTINSAGFTNALGGGSFSVGLADSSTDLVLNFTPVPEPRAALLGGLGLLMLLRRRRN